MKKLLIVFLACWLSACGYHLRGAGQTVVKFKKIYLVGASGLLRDQFDDVLKLSSARLVNSPKEADLQIKVVTEKFKSRSVSLNFSGRTNERELNYLLEFTLLGAGNAELSAGKPIQIIREYFSEQQDILAKNNEESVIRQEIYQQAVRTLLERAKAQMQASAK